MECVINLFDGVGRGITTAVDIVGKLTLRNTGNTRQSGERQFSAVIGQKRGDIIRKIKLKRFHLFREIHAESIDHSQKIIMCLLSGGTFPDSVKLEIIIIGHIRAINAILGTLNKYSDRFHLVISLNGYRNERGRDTAPLFGLVFLIESGRAEYRFQSSGSNFASSVIACGKLLAGNGVLP